MDKSILGLHIWCEEIVQLCYSINMLGGLEGEAFLADKVMIYHALMHDFFAFQNFAANSA